MSERQGLGFALTPANPPRWAALAEKMRNPNANMFEREAGAAPVTSQSAPRSAFNMDNSSLLPTMSAFQEDVGSAAALQSFPALILSHSLSPPANAKNSDLPATIPDVEADMDPTMWDYVSLPDDAEDEKQDASNQPSLWEEFEAIMEQEKRGERSMWKGFESWEDVERVEKRLEREKQDKLADSVLDLALPNNFDEMEDEMEQDMPDHQSTMAKNGWKESKDLDNIFLTVFPKDTDGNDHEIYRQDREMDLHSLLVDKEMQYIQSLARNQELYDLYKLYGS
jgi:hypothetical protein